MQFNPQLKPIAVSVHQLFLDPANPRLFGHADSKIEKENPTSSVTQTKLRNLLSTKEDKFKINTLEQSIMSNGWQPVDLMFVKEIAGEKGKYLVLEGNRRLATIMDVLQNSAAPDELKTSLRTLNVMECIQGDLSDSEFKRQIDYLLGVRHHGSLLEWRPYAQAKRIYETYMSVAEETAFSWDDAVAGKVAAKLTMSKKVVQERLETFIVMRQAEAFLTDETGQSGCMKAHYYSITRELLNRSTKGRMQELFPRDSVTFEFTNHESMKRLDNLCHFSKPGRSGAPMSSPPEWRSYSKIVEDSDSNVRTQNLTKVEFEGAKGFKEKPSKVWAQRSSELHRPTWPVWLRNTLHALELNVTKIEWTEESEKLITRLRQALNELDSQVVNTGGE